MEGGSAINPGSATEMSSLRAEHGGAISVLLVLYALQTFLRDEDTTIYTIYIWLDNAEILKRGQEKDIGTNMNSNLVLDYDMWRVMKML